jgi:polyketide cyclase/dehydrase/lipid transport protein
MRTWTAESEASARGVWALLAQPEAWPQWAPHLRGAWGLGAPEVRVGASGAARLLGVVPVPARITAKREGESWTWRVGPVEFVHRVIERERGCTVAIDLRAPGPLEPAVAASYGPVIQLMLNRLARAASETAR